MQKKNGTKLLTDKRITIMIFMVVFILELAGGIYVGYFKNAIITDALSRTANAFYVLFVEPPRFASIGLVWNPLPSVLQLPFVALADFWKPLVTNGIAAAIVNSLFAAGGAVVLFKTFIKLNINKIYIAILLPLYVFNPYIFFYGFNGMSEGIFFFFAIYAVCNLTLWIKEGNAEQYILRIAFALAMAFFCRYEAIPFAAAIGVGVLIAMLLCPKEKKTFPAEFKFEKYFYAEGTMFILYAPLAFSVLLWIVFNWVIAGDPLYFLTSAYSNVAQSQYAAALQTQFDVIALILRKALPFIIVFLGIVVIRIINKSLFRYDFLILLILVLTMLAFHYVMLLRDTSYGWVRFFSYALPICFAWVPYELSQLKETGQTGKVACAILVLTLFFSWGITNSILHDPSSDECSVFVSSEYEIVATYINENIDLEEDKILMDAFKLYAAMLYLDNFSNVITSSSLDFADAVEYPWHYNVDYILVPSPEETGSLDAINTKYPELYNEGEDWCVKIKDFDGFKLFEVLY